MSSPTPLLLLLLSLSLISSAHSHGVMAKPNQRGSLTKFRFNPQSPIIDAEADIDFWPHYPAGAKCDVPGCGVRSQERAAGSGGWKPFTPLDRHYRWHAGVCGDAFGNPEHIKGGKYYNDGKIVATYKQGSKIAIEINIIAHHNGFFEFHICNVERCDRGEINEKCFRDGHCKQLQRSRHRGCDSGYSKECAPIDPNYPGRWYLPCSRFGLADGLETYGKGGTILYDLPENMVTKHAVLQWYWGTANGCNPPGVIEYYDSPSAPKNWGQCVGQGGAKGGVAREQRACGKDEDGKLRFAEEYLQCADVQIEPSHGRSVPRQAAPVLAAPPTLSPTPSKSPKPEPRKTPKPEPKSAPSPKVSPEDSSASGVGGRSGEEMPSRSGLIADLQLYADGESVRSINDGDEIDVSGYDGFTVEAVTTRQVSKLQFFINGNHVRDEYYERYFLNGNHGADVFYWKNPILNEEFTLVTKAEGDMDTVRIKFVDGA